MSRSNHADDTEVTPLYLAFNASQGMAGNAITTVNRLVGEVVALITSDLQLSESVRLHIVALDDRARRLLSLSDLDTKAQVPSAVAGDYPVVEAGALVGLLVTIDDDWQRLGGDKLSRKRPFVVLFSAADPSGAVAGWTQPLHEPATLIKEEGKTIWPRSSWWSVRVGAERRRAGFPTAADEGNDADAEPTRRRSEYGHAAAHACSFYLVPI